MKLKFALENVYDKSYKRQKQSSALPMACGQIAASQIRIKNEQQQQQPANHISDNAEIARCLTPFTHPCLDKQVDRLDV